MSGCHHHRGHRPGPPVIVIWPTAAVTDPIFFCHQLPPRRVGRNGTVVRDSVIFEMGLQWGRFRVFDIDLWRNLIDGDKGIHH